MRKLSSFIALLIVFAMLVPTVFAADQIELEQAIVNAVSTGERVDLSRFEIKDDEFSKICTMLYQTGRLPWYAEHSFEWTATEDGMIVEFVPKALSAYGYNFDIYEQKIAELIHATCLGGMTDWQKALSVHDYIAMHVSYDMTQQKNSAYTALVEGVSACAGYAQLYMDVMRRIGIPCQIAECDDTGEGIGHAWNMICIEDAWYHVDVTWDDATPDVFGRVLHDHFLRTDDQFNTEDNGHNFGWSAYIACDGKKYSSDMPWEGVDSAVCFGVDGAMYINRSNEGVNKIVKVDSASFAQSEIFVGEQVILNLGEGDALYPTMGLSLVEDRLYFNSPKEVISISLDGGSKTVEYTLSATDKFIMGSFVDQGNVLLSVANHGMEMYNEQATVSVAGHVHSYISDGELAANCQSGGGVIMRCECGTSYIAGKSAPLAHDLESNGDGTYVCRTCGYSIEQFEAKTVKGDSGLGVWLWVGIGLIAVVVVVIIVGKSKR